MSVWWPIQTHWNSMTYPGNAFKKHCAATALPVSKSKAMKISTSSPALNCCQSAVLLVKLFFFNFSLSHTTSNWQVMDLSDSNNLKKYYINVCRPISPVHGCDRDASICEMKYVTKQVCNIKHLHWIREMRHYWGRTHSSCQSSGEYQTFPGGDQTVNCSNTKYSLSIILKTPCQNQNLDTSESSHTPLCQLWLGSRGLDGMRFSKVLRQIWLWIFSHCIEILCIYSLTRRTVKLTWKGALLQIHFGFMIDCVNFSCWF